MRFGEYFDDLFPIGVYVYLQNIRDGRLEQQFHLWEYIKANFLINSFLPAVPDDAGAFFVTPTPHHFLDRLISQGYL
ncbi:hypothetical protein ES703_111412 [subsurface metagenome]